MLNPVPGPTDQLFGKRVPGKKSFEFLLFLIFKQNFFFDTGLGFRRQIFSKNVTSISAYLSNDPSTINFKLKIINYISCNEFILDYRKALNPSAAP